MKTNIYELVKAVNITGRAKEKITAGKGVYFSQTYDRIINTFEMNDNDINNALTLFKQAIKDGKITGSNLDQTCYISSSSIIGLYLPNSNDIEIFKSRKDYTFTAIALANEDEYMHTAKLGVIFTINDECENKNIKSEYYFTSFEELLTDNTERDIAQNKLSFLKQYEYDLSKLEKFERLYTKDGSDFKILGKNFNVNVCKATYGTAYIVNCVSVYLEQDEQATPENIEKAVNKRIASLKKTIDVYNTTLCNLHDIMNKTRKQVAKINEFIASFNLDVQYDVKTYIERNIKTNR